MSSGDSAGTGFGIGSFTASSAAQARPDSQILAPAGGEIELSWSIAGKPDKLFLAVEEPTGPFAWRVVLEEPIDAASGSAKRKAPELAADAKEKRYRYRLTAQAGDQRAHASIEVYVHAPQSGRVHSQVARLRQRGSGAGDEGYLHLKQIVDELIKARKEARQKGTDIKLAITATGGGARGAWEAGAGEALFRALREADIRPSILAGTSAGGLVATGLFADWVYEKAARPDAQGVLSKQGGLWRDIANGKGSERIGGERGIFLRWASGEQDHPFKKVERDCNAIGDMVKAAVAAQVSLFKATKNFPFVSTGVADYIVKNVLNFAGSGLQPDEEARRHMQSIKDATAAFDSAAPWDKVGAALNLAVKAVAAPWEGLLKALNIVGGAFGEIEHRARDFGKDVETFLHDAGNAMQTLLRGAIALQHLEGDVSMILGTLGYFAGAAFTQDHLLEHVYIRALIEDLVAKCFGAGHRENPPPHPDSDDTVAGKGTAIHYQWSRMVHDWEENGAEPQLFLTAASLNASRLTVFAAAHQESIKALMNEGIWTVDITDQVDPSKFKDAHGNPAPEHFFNVAAGMREDPLVKAALTTAALPFAFPVQKWELSRVVPPLTQASRDLHYFTDGGVVDSSPIDIAVYAGATHVISLEMTPLLVNAWTYGGWPRKGPSNMLEVAQQSFYTAMDGALLRTIQNLVREQRDVQIYRLAPFAPRTTRGRDQDSGDSEAVSPDITSFDGVFDTNRKLKMSLDDWFMQGYLDAASLDDAAAADDPVFNPYQAAKKSPQPATPMGNLYWRVTGEAPLPERPPEHAKLPVPLLVTTVT